jgi:predicted DNA-binding protein YlxM (UPF0122 family)
MADAYGALLTERQRQVWELVYDQDWSLTEVAAALSITRAAVAELLKRSADHLERLEARLALVAEAERRERHFAAWGRLLETLDDGPARRALVRLRAAWMAEEGFRSDDGAVQPDEPA